MMESQLLSSTFNFAFSTFQQSTPYDQHLDFCKLDESCFSSENSSMIFSDSTVPPIFSEKFFNELLDFNNSRDGVQVSSAIESLEDISNGDIGDICEWLDASNSEENLSTFLHMEADDWSPCLSSESSQNSAIFPLTDMSLVFPRDEMEIDDQLSLLHLLRAYVESMEKGEMDLADIIVKSINKKSSPMGTAMERVAYNLFRSRESQGEYLRQESCNNFIAAFMVFYQSLPYGRFAHFTANSTILESVPSDATVIHIVDFDMGEGIQWPPLIEALSQNQKIVRLTSLKSEEISSTSYWNFEETKNRLLLHASQHGLKLHMEEKRMDDLVNELTVRKRSQNREWLVFNCMVGLPHMGRRQPRSHVTQFLKTAKGLLTHFEGITVLGDGEAWESTNTVSSYTSFINGRLQHYQALFESLERDFPSYLVEARTAIESLFLAPFMCPVAWIQDWESNITESFDLGKETGMKGQMMSHTTLAEAMQMVNERENSYTIKIEGLREIVLQWKETPLVRVSTWM